MNAVRKTVTVQAPREVAFRVFTEGMTSWWLLETHHIGKVPAVSVVMEPFAGGRLFERGNDGSECDWGRVRVWEPPQRLIFDWQLTAEWQYDPEFATPVEVTFVAENEQVTRVTLEHRNLERFGEAAARVRESLDSPGGWSGLLDRFVKVAGEQR